MGRGVRGLGARRCERGFGGTLESGARLGAWKVIGEDGRRQGRGSGWSKGNGLGVRVRVRGREEA